MRIMLCNSVPNRPGLVKGGQNVSPLASGVVMKITPPLAKLKKIVVPPAGTRVVKPQPNLFVAAAVIGIIVVVILRK